MAKFDLNDDGVVVIVGSGAGGNKPKKSRKITKITI